MATKARHLRKECRSRARRRGRRRGEQACARRCRSRAGRFVVDGERRLGRITSASGGEGEVRPVRAAKLLLFPLPPWTRWPPPTPPAGPTAQRRTRPVSAPPPLLPRTGPPARTDASWSAQAGGAGFTGGGRASGVKEEMGEKEREA